MKSVKLKDINKKAVQFQRVPATISVPVIQCLYQELGNTIPELDYRSQFIFRAKHFYFANLILGERWTISLPLSWKKSNRRKFGYFRVNICCEQKLQKSITQSIRRIQQHSSFKLSQNKRSSYNQSMAGKWGVPDTLKTLQLTERGNTPRQSCRII